MWPLLLAFAAFLRASFRRRVELEPEVLALRHQLAVLQRAATKRPRLRRVDRLLWVVLSTIWPHWRQPVHIVRPATIVRWHRRGFAVYWRWTSRPRRPGRPPVVPDLRALIRRMSHANPLWGAPRLHGELLKLGFRSEVSPTTVAKYLARRTPPALTHVARLLTGSHRADGRGGFLHGSDPDIPRVVRPRAVRKPGRVRRRRGTLALWNLHSTHGHDTPPLEPTRR